MKKSGGIVIKKKNSFQKHKNAEAERKKAQEEEEAKVLAEFEETFGVKQEDASKTMPQRPKPGARSVMPQAAMGMARPSQPGPARHMSGAIDRPQALSQRPPELPASKGGTRQIDLLTEKLKGEKEVREDRMRVLGAVGMAHLAAQEAEPDNNSTNLYVTNLYRSVTEDILMETFGRYGPLASVKIMWPRMEEERATKMHNSGFVGFMARKHAEAALQNLHGSLLHGSELKVGFGKAIPIPPQPIYPRPQHVQHLQNHMAAVAHGVANASQRKTWGRGEADDKVLHRGCGKPIHVEFPAEERVRFVIDTLARFIIEDGTDMEQVLLEAEANNPEFEFLRNVHCPEHMYYRWKLYSLCNEDSMAEWRTDPFVMIEDSNRIHPPPLHSKSFQSETAAQRGSERERDMQLSDLEREKLEDMLRQIKVERTNIQAAMVFALDHASCAAEISDCLVASLTLAETPLHLKIARLYLASDILHNSTVPVRNASRYRQLLQAELPSVFQSFHDALLSAEAALKREAFKRNSLRVLRVWRDWYLFTEDYLNGLQATFLMDTDSKWRRLCPEQLTEWTAMPDDELGRTCKMMGVLYDEESRDVCLDRLVMQHVFSLFGVHGPPASVLETLVSNKQENRGEEPSTAIPSTKLGLLAAYESDSDAEDGAKDGQSDREKAPGQGTSRWASDNEVHLKDVDLQEKAQQWEQIEEEAEPADEKPLSQWLLEKQAQAAAEAEAKRREEAALRAQMQQEAQERLRQLEQEEYEAEEKLRQGLNLEEGESLPDRAARQRLQQPHGQHTDSTHIEGSMPAVGVNAAGLTPDDHRKQLREVELRAVELQEELLEEVGWQAEDVQIRCNELRAKLLARIEAGDLLDSDVSRSATRREDLDWALRRTSRKQREPTQNHQDDGTQRLDADCSGRGKYRGSPPDDRSTRDRDREDVRRDSRCGGHRSYDMHGSLARHRDTDKGEDTERPTRYRRDSGTDERGTEGRYSRSHARDDAGRYRRDRSRSRERDRDKRADRGNRGREDDRDSKRVRRR